METIHELNKGLGNFVGDQEAWPELAGLYINERDYTKATFCLQELVMTYPHDHLHCQHCAVVTDAQGKPEDLGISTKCFAQALKLNNRNKRALSGLCICTVTLLLIQKKVHRQKSTT